MSSRRRLARNSKHRLTANPIPRTLFGRPVQIENRSSGHTEAQALLIDRIARDLVEQALKQGEMEA